MFEISFSELLVIAVVALMVIGPEKLPKVARTAGAFFGRMQRMVAQVKDEVNREARFAELQKLQGEVESSLQQELDAVSHSILPPSAVIDAPPSMQEVGAASVNAVRKPRKKAEQVVVDAEVVPARKSRRKPVDHASKAHGEPDTVSTATAADLPKSRARRAKRKVELPAPAPDEKSA